MECGTLFYAAEYGELSQLKDILENKSEDEVRALVSCLTNGLTPLIMACRNGHLDVVSYLLHECHADVEQTGSIEFIGRGTPLFWAVESGHLNIVKILIEYKVSVNRITELERPLRIACMHNYIEIAKYLIKCGAKVDQPDNCYGNCLHITCSEGYYELSKYVIECGADVNRKNKEEITPLHASALCGNLDMFKLVLEHGAIMSSDENGITPLLLAAHLGYARIVNYVIAKDKCTKEETINALELFGATVVDKTQNLISGRKYWRMAMKLRYKDSAFPLKKPIGKSPLSSYFHATEVRTVGELDELNDEEIELQALMIRERVLGSSYLDSLNYIKLRASAYVKKGNFERCIKLLMYVFDTDTDNESNMFNDDLLNCVDVFYKMQWI